MEAENALKAIILIIVILFLLTLLIKFWSLIGVLKWLRDSLLGS